MRKDLIPLFILLYIALHIKTGELGAQGFPYPQTYPQTFIYQRYVGDIEELPPPPIKANIPPPGNRAGQIDQSIAQPVQSFDHKGRRLSSNTSSNNGWFYTKRSYDQALKESKERQRRLLRESYPSKVGNQAPETNLR